MAPKRKDTEDTIDKRYLRRPQIVLRTLPPIVFTSPPQTLAFQLTMSVSGIKPSRSAAPQLEGRPSYERDFGINTHERYADPQNVQREFQHVNQRVEEVKTELRTATDALDEKITGLEKRLTARMDSKFEELEKKYLQRMLRLQLTFEINYDNHSETVAARFDNTDKRIDERFAKVDEQFSKVDEQFSKVDEQFSKVDERFSKVDGRLDTIEEDISDMKGDMKQIKQMLQHLLMQGGVPPTPLASSSSQARILPNPPQVVVDAPPPSASSSRRHRRSSATRRDAEPIDSHSSEREELAGLLHTIKRQASRGFSLLRKSKERLDQ